MKPAVADTVAAPHAPRGKSILSYRRSLLGGVAAAALGLSALLPGVGNPATEVTVLGSVLPSIAVASDTQGVELGLKFVPRVDGSVTAVRFYKGGSSNGGTHQGRLWTSSGTKLADVVFTGESSAGWQIAKLATPVKLTKGTTYVVSYLAPEGKYSATGQTFTSETTSTYFTTPANAGVYRYGSGGGFPTSSYQGTNYFVDLSFSPTSTAPTPTPTPTSTAVAPTTGFPTIQTVGWQPTGVTLKSYTGPTTITTTGTVIDGADIRGNIVVRANNVTIKRSRVMGTSDFVVYQASGYSGLTLSNVEVTSSSGGKGDRAIASLGTGLNVDRSYVHGTQRGIAVGNGTTVTNSYVDDLDNSSANHSTAIAAWGNTNDVTLRHNTLGCGTGYCSSAMSVYPEQGPNNNWTIDGNLFNGGGYCVYLGYTPSSGEKPNTNMKVTNNSFGTKYNTNCGTYGPVASWSWSTGNTWTNNVWYAPGQAKNARAVTP